MNPKINMAYRMKYLAIGLVCYPVIVYALKAWQNKKAGKAKSSETNLGD